jgi:hypothetical protein
MKLTTVFMGAALLGGTCAFAAPLPKIERSDLAACPQELATFRDKEIDYMTRAAAKVCDTQMEHFDKQNCTEWQAWLKEDIAKEDVQWWFEGREACSDDVPCWGPNTWNKSDTGEEYKVSTSKHLAGLELGKPPAKDWTDDGVPEGLQHWSWVVDSCVARQWLAKHEAWKAAGNTDSPSAANFPAEDVRPSAPASEGGLHAAHCAEALAKQDAEFDAMTRNAPGPGQDNNLGGARALYQMGMYITDERLKLLDQFCKGEPQYAMYSGTKASYDSALTGCKQVSSDGGESCKPLKLW